MSARSRVRILETERLVLTTWLAYDVEDLFVVHSDAETMRFVRRGRPDSRAETQALVDEYLVEQERGGVTRWRLADSDGRLVGRAGFGEVGDGRGRELSYTIRRDLWGRGLATEIAGALVDWHRAHAPDPTLHARVAVDNPASERVLVKTGFEHVGSEEIAGVPCRVFLLRS